MPENCTGYSYVFICSRSFFFGSHLTSLSYLISMPVLFFTGPFFIPLLCSPYTFHLGSFSAPFRALSFVSPLSLASLCHLSRPLSGLIVFSLLRHQKQRSNSLVSAKNSLAFCVSTLMHFVSPLRPFFPLQVLQVLFRCFSKNTCNLFYCLLPPVFHSFRFFLRIFLSLSSSYPISLWQFGVYNPI